MEVLWQGETAQRLWGLVLVLIFQKTYRWAGSNVCQEVRPEGVEGTPVPSWQGNSERGTAVVLDLLIEPGGDPVKGGRGAGVKSEAGLVVEPQQDWPVDAGNTGRDRNEITGTSAEDRTVGASGFRGTNGIWVQWHHECWRRCKQEEGHGRGCGGAPHGALSVWAPRLRC